MVLDGTNVATEIKGIVETNMEGIQFATYLEPSSKVADVDESIQVMNVDLVGGP